MLEERVRRRSHNREGSSQRNGRVRRVDDLGEERGEKTEGKNSTPDSRGQSRVTSLVIRP